MQVYIHTSTNRYISERVVDIVLDWRLVLVQVVVETLVSDIS